MLARRDYTYKITVPPAELAVSLATAKAHLKVTSSTEDALITLYLEAAIDYAEKFTRRDLITRTYITFRDFFPAPAQNEGYYPCGQIPSVSSGFSTFSSNVGFELRKSPLQSVEQIEYFSQSVLTLLDNTIYYNTIEEDYSELLTVVGKDWPTQLDQRLQAIQITFKTGFGDTETDIPHGYRAAILQHVAALYANRGDCDDSSCAAMVPAAAKTFYLQNRIENL
jgi:hypothetical protein